MPGLNEAKQASASGLHALMKRYSEVQLATLVATPPEGAQWLHEIKFDGYRLLAYVFGGASRLLTRNGKDWTNKFPSLSSALEKLPVKNAVLDMEAVMLDEDGKSSFQSLQAALGEGGNRASIVAYVFDLLYVDDADITKKPLLDRKERLQTLLKSNKLPLRYSGHVLGQRCGNVCQCLRNGPLGNHLEGSQCAICWRTPKKLAEDQMLSTPGVHHRRLQRCTQGRARVRGAVLGLSEAWHTAIRR